MLLMVLLCVGTLDKALRVLAHSRGTRTDSRSAPVAVFIRDLRDILLQ